MWKRLRRAFITTLRKITILPQKKLFQENTFQVELLDTPKIRWLTGMSQQGSPSKKDLRMRIQNTGKG